MIKDEIFYVPWFPQQGGWRLELWAFDPVTNLIGVNFITWSFNVGESDIFDNLFAPIYVTWGGVVGVGWGASSFALPGIFWLTCPVWGFFAFAFTIRFYRGSFKLGMHDLRKGIEELNKRIKRKVVKK